MWVFLGLTFLISWGLGAAYLLVPAMARLLGPLNPSGVGFYIAGYAPTLSAVLCALAFGGFRGLRQLLGRLARPFGWAWLPVAALFFPLLALLLAAIMPHIVSTWPVRPGAILTALPLMLFTTAQIVTNTGPLGEELGWRGFALPRLLTRWNATTCGVILGLVWTLWHVPAFFIPGAMGMPLANFGWWALDTVALSLFMTWLFVRANGNIVVAGMIPHFVINGLGRAGGWESRPVEASALALFMLVIILLYGLDFGQDFKGDREI